MIKKIEQSPINTLHAVIILLAMLLAAQMQYIQHGWINPDSILYFESAKLIAVGQWKEALQVWNWPLYPILIATVHKITFLGIQASAQVLNVLFFGLTAFSFIQIIRLAGGKQLTMVAGALILFSSQYIVGDVLEMLMRDEGFWAFYLTSIVFFIRFYQGFKLKDALLWQVSAIIATLFRIEAITYLVLLPTLVLVCMNADLKTRIRYFLMSHSLNLFLALALILFLALHGDFSMKNLGRLQEVFTLNLYEELTRQLFSHAAIMSNDVLGKYLEEFAVQGLLLTFIYVMIVKAISTTGLINFIMAVFTVKNRSALIESKSFQVLTAIALISLMNMALIITKVFVLSSRYVVGLAFILMIFAAFQFATILMRSTGKSENSQRKQWLAVALIVFMTLSIVKNILPKAEGYNYMQDAAAWIKTYNKDNKPVFYDETRVRYYLNEPYSRNAEFNWPAIKSAIENGSIKNYDILMISHSKKRPEQEVLIAEQLPEYSEIKRFSQSKEKKSIVIYRKN
ncbi:hypothetical protein [Methylotenera sp.]|uniref:hypothetical protein n=1 Tax=Methylotenera sp. TaxID=2051956 RepID=UPI002729B743|nr:hypothetical protein [Methylotenera sp.]